MPLTDHPALWDLIVEAGLQPQFSLSDPQRHVALGELDGASSLGLGLQEIRGKTIVIYARRQLSSALAAIELDGIAGRMILCPPDLPESRLPSVIADANADIVLAEDPDRLETLSGTRIAACGLPLIRTGNGTGSRAGADQTTEWLLFTSGTTGNPKMVVHTLGSLIGPLRTPGTATLPRWSSFYDIRRYGGLQILLRALSGGAPMALSDPDEPIGDFLIRLGDFGVTHISGTPSHWRRALMSPAIHKISPAYIRLSGEIADQTILNNLQTVFPAAKIAHAFASTEAGVAFDVGDGLAGFPAEWVESSQQAVQMRVDDGTLRIRSLRLASGYAGDNNRHLMDDDGFVDTGDTVTLRDGRYYFTGRREGVINVGGLKVHPEEVEAVVNLHPNVRMSRVKARKSPITGAIVVADIVLEQNQNGESDDFPKTRDEILTTCRSMLPVHKVPAFLRAVSALEINAAGKLLRRDA